MDSLILGFRALDGLELYQKYYGKPEEKREVKDLLDEISVSLQTMVEKLDLD